MKGWVVQKHQKCKHRATIQLKFCLILFNAMEGCYRLDGEMDVVVNAALTALLFSLINNWPATMISFEIKSIITESWPAFQSLRNDKWFFLTDFKKSNLSSILVGMEWNSNLMQRTFRAIKVIDRLNMFICSDKSHVHGKIEEK